MQSAILSAELFGVLVMMIILYGIGIESKQNNKKMKTFKVLAWVTLFTIFFDSITYMPIVWGNFSWILKITTCCSFVLPLLSFAVFLDYLYLYIADKAAIPRYIFNIGMLYSVTMAGISIVLGTLGLLFTINNGVYSEGPLYKTYLMTYVAVILYTIAVVLRYSKYLGLHDSLAALSFVGIPVAFIVLNYFVAEMAFSIPSIALSMLIISYTLQGKTERKLMQNQAEAAMKARNDELTGLPNRLAYTEMCASIKGKESVGVVFADVNGLKYANDYYGHKAGDALLCLFTGMLVKVFRKNEVFRISGDEFVVIATGVPKELFDLRTDELRRLINEQEMPVASMGCAFGSVEELTSLVEQAEQLMYEEKKVIHEKYPIYNRKN